MKVLGVILLAVGLVAMLNVAWPIVLVAVGASILIGAKIERSSDSVWVRFGWPKIRWDRGDSTKTDKGDSAAPPAEGTTDPAN